VTGSFLSLLSAIIVLKIRLFNAFLAVCLRFGAFFRVFRGF